MSVESADDLASFFEEDEFAEEAFYVPPGSVGSVSCLVVLDRGQGRRSFDAGRTEIEGSNRHLWVRVAELDPVARAGRFTMACSGEVLEVADMPELDHTGSVWSVELVKRI
jgi:hypothetical protein